MTILLSPVHAAPFPGKERIYEVPSFSEGRRARGDLSVRHKDTEKSEAMLQVITT
jgi:hypothetical protein